MSEWNEAITAALGVIPGGNTADPQEIADAIRALLRDETPRGIADRNIGRRAKWGDHLGRIVGVRNDKKHRLCYVLAGPYGRVELPVESVEVV